MRGPPRCGLRDNPLPIVACYNWEAAELREKIFWSFTGLQVGSRYYDNPKDLFNEVSPCNVASLQVGWLPVA